MSAQKCIVLGVTGSIAAYKAAELVSKLGKIGYAVRVILTAGGSEFITPLTLETLSRAPVACGQFSRNAPYEVAHIALAKRADVFAVAPATADFIAKAANGIADDLLSTTYLATTAPIVIAPAMNESMLARAATQRNIATLKADGCIFAEPETGLLACGDTGRGRLAPVGDIVAAIESALQREKDLSGKRILVTAGPTREAVDPVRFLSNRSSGKMGFAIARAAANRGAEVRLIAGPVALATPFGVIRQDVTSSAQLCEAVLGAANWCDALIMAAAPADFTIDAARHKIKKQGEGITLSLKPTADILAQVAGRKGNCIVMGFAAETQKLEENALQKIRKKNLDFIAANDVSAANMGFGVDTNAVTLFCKDGQKVDSGLKSKRELADWLLNYIAAALDG
ncbi:MAG: bifunctional phosphopantothenoylcysteine decarboxylase/phosphopantothenate--cysteine ligase CoaBC [Clostridiales bacterium]|jgi:phosphopantothenoylcysteine decarboxylase/phosphopantothenate--cysteine ligase|nr:bifunctional phosphopantothenoylcysteine decarboxylase/phosphopantothenate--cysteine ligase CoaBC [Clostridiales bacterium]